MLHVAFHRKWFPMKYPKLPLSAPKSQEQLPQEAQPEQGEKGNPGLYFEPEPQDRHPEHCLVNEIPLTHRVDL